MLIRQFRTQYYPEREPLHIIPYQTNKQYILVYVMKCVLKLFVIYMLFKHTTGLEQNYRLLVL